MIPNDRMHTVAPTPSQKSGSNETAPFVIDGKLPNRTLVRSHSTHNSPLVEGIKTMTQGVLKESGEQVGDTLENPSLASFKIVQVTDTSSVVSSSDKDEGVIIGLSQHRLRSSVGCYTNELNEAYAFKILGASQEFQRYCDAIKEVQLLRKKLDAAITIGSQVLKKSKKQSYQTLSDSMNDINDAENALSEWLSQFENQTFFMNVQDFAKKMGHAVKKGQYTRKQAIDAIKRFVSLTQQCSTECEILESRAMRASAKLLIAIIKYHPKKTVLAGLKKKEAKKQASDWTKNLKKQAKRTDSQIEDSANDIRFQNKPDMFISLMDRVIADKV